MNWHEVIKNRKEEIKNRWGDDDCIDRFSIGSEYTIGFYMMTRPYYLEYNHPMHNMVICYLDIGLLHLDIGAVNKMISDPMPSMNPFHLNYLKEKRIRELKGWYNKDVTFHEICQGKWRSEDHPDNNGTKCCGYEIHYLKRIN